MQPRLDRCDGSGPGARLGWWQFTSSTKGARDQLLLVSRSLKRVTVFEDHCPPVALLILRRFSSAAICRADGKWASSSRIGRIRSASSSACTARPPYNDRPEPANSSR
jgi:hypothetical protein